MKEPEVYKSFVYFYEGMPTEEATNQVGNQQQVSVTTDTHPMNTKMHSGTKLYLDVELQNEEIKHFDSKVSTHERDVEIPDRDAYSDTKAKRQIEETRNEEFDVKSDEGIFLRYSTRYKAYKCLNTNTNKIVESANINFDEYTKVHDDESIKRPEEYRSSI